jgi:preprotein translocase subunit YajC
MWDVAWAQTSPGVAGPPLWPQMLVFGAIFLVFYLLLVRPQQKKMREHRDMLARLKKGDEVVTSGGIYGKIVGLTDAVVTLEVTPNVRLRVARPQISSLAAPEKGSAKETKEQ